MITFQKATVDDISEIKKLLLTTWTFAYKDILTRDEIKRVTAKWHDSAVLIKEMDNPKMIFLITKIANQIVGICNAESKENGKIVYIVRMHVLPSYHRQGIGTKLIKEIFRVSPNVQVALLEVEKENKNAYRFYEALGFRQVNEKKFVVDGITLNCWVMEKLLEKKK